MTLEDLYQDFLLKTKMHQIKRPVFDTFRSMALLMNKHGVCEVSRETINSSKLNPVRRLETISDHIRVLLREKVLQEEYPESGSGSPKRYLVTNRNPSGNPDHFPEINYYLRSVNEVSSNWEETQGSHSQFTTTALTSGDKFDDLPCGRHELSQPAEEKEEDDELEGWIKDIQELGFPKLSRVQISLLCGRHRNQFAGGIAHAKKNAKRRNQEHDAFKFLQLFMAYLGKIMIKKDSGSPEASNKAGANKPPRSGQKSRDEAQISSERHLDNEPRQAYQDGIPVPPFLNQRELKIYLDHKDWTRAEVTEILCGFSEDRYRVEDLIDDFELTEDQYDKELFEKLRPFPPIQVN